MPSTPPRVVVVGGGFAGHYAVKRLEQLLAPDQARLTLVSPTDHLLYSPLLPDVAIGAIDPRDIAVPHARSFSRTEVLLAHVVAVDTAAQTLRLRDADGARTTEAYDRLVLAPGSVTRAPEIEGADAHVHGLKTLDEARFLRNHLMHQLDLAEDLPETAEGRAERAELLTVVAVGAGYTGTEYVAQMQNVMRSIAARSRRLDPSHVRWVLVDSSDEVLPELGDHLGRVALSVLRKRGVEVRLGVSLEQVTATSVTLTDGTVIPTRTVVWSAGVTASPLVQSLGLATDKGRLRTRPDLSVPGVEHVWALGDAAAVPDLSKRPDRNGGRPLTAPTAQHAQRQGQQVGTNVAASLGVGTAKDYKHTDLGLVADLGGLAAVAKPLGVPLSGPLAKAVARGYHLYALPSTPHRLRVTTNWLFHALLPARVLQQGDVRPEDALVKNAQDTEIYP